MNHPTPAEFCERHDACDEGVVFSAQYKSMAEVWAPCPRADWLIWILRRVRDDSWTEEERKQLRLLACRFVRETPLHDGRKVWDLLTHDDSRSAVVVAEEFAHGRATEEQLREAFKKALDVWRSALATEADAATEAALAALAATAATAAIAGYAVEASANKWQADKFREMFANPFAEATP